MDQKTLESVEAKMLEVMNSLVEKQIPEIVAKAMTEKLEAIQKQLDVKNIQTDLPFPVNATEKEKVSITRKGQLAKFIKGMYLKDAKLLQEAGLKGMTEGVDSQGGFLVPEELATEIDRIKKNVGLIRKLARRVPMTTDQIGMNKLGSSVSVTWVGEATAGTGSTPDFKKVQLMAKTAECIPAINLSLMTLQFYPLSRSPAGSYLIKKIMADRGKESTLTVDAQEKAYLKDTGLLTFTMNVWYGSAYFS
jgi:HK97 family phage major capsid protein